MAFITFYYVLTRELVDSIESYDALDTQRPCDQW